MQKSRQRGVWIAILLIASLAAPAAAFEPAAQVNAGAGAMEWAVQGTWDKFVLSVSAPDGSVIRKEFKGSEIPSFSLFDKKGQNRPDGSYRWELQVSKRADKKTREALAAARRAGNAEAEAELTKALPRGAVLSGSFAIEGGSLLTPSPMAEPATSVADRDIPTKDQVIPDDLIVQGSGCFGFDCVNNENFGFDTIRLKENNLRIKFEDTSVGAFPSNDWQLLANDSASGGSNKFTIEDVTGSRVPFTITAGASNNSIFVDSTGRVGFRTSTPVLDLHVNTSNTPAIRLEQNNTGGFTAQTWDIAGNEANFFVRDVTGGSLLSFRIRPGAPTSSLDISADGDVGVGTGSPDTKLHVFSSDNANEVVLMENTNSTGTTALAGYRAQADVANISFQSHGSARTLTRFGQTLGSWGELLQTTGNGLILGTLGTTPLILGTSSTNRIFIASGGNIGLGGNTTPASPIHHSNGATLSATGQWINASSRSLKQDIRDLSTEEAFDTLQGLHPVKYAYKTVPTETQVGFIAEDLPELVAEGQRLGIDPTEVVAVLTKVVQQQQETIDKLEARLSEIEKQKQ